MDGAMDADNGPGPDDVAGQPDGNSNIVLLSLLQCVSGNSLAEGSGVIPNLVGLTDTSP